MAKIKTTSGPGRMVRIWIVAGTLFALVAAVLIAYQLGRGTSDTSEDRDATTERTGDQNAASSPQLTPPVDEWEVAPAEQLSLPASTTSDAGWPVGYPQSPAGGAAFAIAATEATATRDKAELTEVASAYFATSEDEASEVAEQLSTRWENVALVSGDDTEVAVEVYGVSTTVDEQDPDVLYVALLYRVRAETDKDSFEADAGEMLALRWSEGRWRTGEATVPTSVSQAAPAAAGPGTAEFNQQGWAAIERSEQ